MSVYAIAQGRIDDREQFDQYIALATPTLEAHNVKLLALDEHPTVVEGETQYPRTVILEFESSDAFFNWYNSDEYKAAREHRLSASEGRFILVE
jgi:uncharacterized protein (DUF1330 family)